MSRWACPFLDGEVELTDERRRHVTAQHPELAASLDQVLAETLGGPDRVTRSVRVANALLFSRWYNELRGGKYVVVVVMSDKGPANRHWIITAYLTGKLHQGAVEWPTS